MNTIKIENNEKFPTILVVGGAGYIGSHTVWELLKTLEFNVIVYDNFGNGYKEALNEVKKMFEEQKKKKKSSNFPNFNIEKGDIQDEEKLDSVFKKYKIDTVMHFCGLIIVPESVKKPMKYYDNNVGGTLKLLKAMENNKVTKFIFSSTAAVFGIPESKNIPISTDCPTKPINPYGWTKLFVERILDDLNNANLIKFVALRYFNACGADKSGRIGEAHKPESHLIPLILQVPLNQRKHISIFGTDYPTRDGTCVRDYIHVTDLATAHIKAIKYLLKGNNSIKLNLGSGKGYSVKEVIQACREVSKHEIKAIEEKRRDGDPPTLIAKSEKAENVLGWVRQYKNIKDIVETAWNWHKNHPKGYDQ